jgi:hypothetical protein
MSILRMVRVVSALAIVASFARLPFVGTLEAEASEEGRFCNDDTGSYCAHGTNWYSDKYCSWSGENACETCCWAPSKTCSGLGSGGNHVGYDAEWNKCGAG